MRQFVHAGTPEQTTQPDILMIPVRSCPRVSPGFDHSHRVVLPEFPQERERVMSQLLHVSYVKRSKHVANYGCDDCAEIFGKKVSDNAIIYSFLKVWDGGEGVGRDKGVAGATR